MRQYLIVIETTKNNFSAYSPDLPGCVATGKNMQETTANVREAVKMHIEGLLEDNLPIPEPQSCARYVSVPL